MLLPFSALDPLLLRLKINKLTTLILLLAGAAATLLPRIELIRDIFVAPTALYMLMLAVMLFIRMREMRARGLAAACVGAMPAFAVKLLLPYALPFEPGLLVGIAAAFGAVVTGRYLKSRIFGAMLAPIFAEIAINIQSFLQLGFVDSSIFGGAFSDVISISLFGTAFIASIAQRSAAAKMCSRV